MENLIIFSEQGLSQVSTTLKKRQQIWNENGCNTKSSLKKKDSYLFMENLAYFISTQKFHEKWFRIILEWKYKILNWWTISLGPWVQFGPSHCYKGNQVAQCTRAQYRFVLSTSTQSVATALCPWPKHLILCKSNMQMPH